MNMFTNILEVVGDSSKSHHRQFLFVKLTETPIVTNTSSRDPFTLDFFFISSCCCRGDS